MLEPTGIDAVLAADLRRHEAVIFDAPETELRPLHDLRIIRLSYFG